MISCTRRIQFCAGHRVLGHENKCANAHGHNYVAYISARSNDLDKVGRVIDFSVLKEKIGGWIDEYWDHSFLVYNKDIQIISISEKLMENKPMAIHNFNPTAENMANYLLNTICPELLKDTGVQVYKIKLYETENCYAEAILD